MPGYGILGPGEGTGLLPWAWADERLRRSRNFWLSSSWPDGRLHCMPVWGVWDGASFWFSSGGRSRKTLNLTADPRCTVATEDAAQPVVIEGVARLVREREEIAAFLSASNEKYETSYELEFLNPDVNATFEVSVRWAFGLDSADFTGSPTRWVFEDYNRLEPGIPR
jgi:general stress protein 26